MAARAQLQKYMILKTCQVCVFGHNSFLQCGVRMSERVPCDLQSSELEDERRPLACSLIFSSTGRFVSSLSAKIPMMSHGKKRRAFYFKSRWYTFSGLRKSSLHIHGVPFFRK